MKSWLRYQGDGTKKGSLANKWRQKRMKLFEDFFYEKFQEKIKNKEIIKIIDIGGTYRYWKALGFKYIDNVDITLVNISKISLPDTDLNIHAMVGDATNLKDINDDEFDLVFSNSCIEHVGGKVAQQKMAKEVKRVGKHYYIQTPNKYFFMEPHFLFPFFQFLPFSIKVFLISHFQLGYRPKGKTKEETLAIAREIDLMSYKDLKQLFPKAMIVHEKVFCGFTKSFMVFE